jgi:3-dehydroquinate synthase
VIGEGLLAELPALLERHSPAARYVIITDSHVAPLYAEPLRQALGGKAMLASFPAGEWNKTRETWSALTDQLLSAGLGRDAAALALGGGVVGDVGGFVAATYLRGIPYVQVPTTLLAMIDSSVGGKTGVDTTAGKNLVGAFHQPRFVAADVSTLATLPKAHISSGMAEALKHGAIADRGYFERLVQAREAILARETAALSDVVTGSVRIKAEVVAGDEKEQGRRAILNFGHTIGHAVEAATGYSLLHGEAIAIGMALETELGITMGITERGDAKALVTALDKFGLPTELPSEIPFDRLLAAMQQDKKVRSGDIRFALISRLGQVARGPKGEWTLPVSPETLRSVLQKAA